MIVRLMTMQPIWTQVGKILQYYGTRQHMSSSNTLVVLSSLRLSVTWPRGKKKKVEWNEWPNSRRKNLFRRSQNHHHHHHHHQQQQKKKKKQRLNSSLPQQLNFNLYCDGLFITAHHSSICFTSQSLSPTEFKRHAAEEEEVGLWVLLLFGKSHEKAHWAIKTSHSMVGGGGKWWRRPPSWTVWSIYSLSEWADDHSLTQPRRVHQDCFNHHLIWICLELRLRLKTSIPIGTLS